jgi:hypothetical protein
MIHPLVVQFVNHSAVSTQNKVHTTHSFQKSIGSGTLILKFQKNPKLRILQSSRMPWRSFLTYVYINPDVKNNAPLSKGSVENSNTITNWILTLLMLPPESMISVITLLRCSHFSGDKRPIILHQVYSHIRIPLVSPRTIAKSGIKLHSRRWFRYPLS